MRAFFVLFAALIALPALAQDLPTIEKKIEGLDRRDGFYPIYWDDDSGKVWLEVGTLEEEFLYVVSLPTGLGSNDIGLDRNQLSTSRVVRFERVGRKLLLVAANLRYRAVSDNPDEVASVRTAFAEGILWSFTVEARTDERFLVDATGFVVRDAHGVIPTLRGRGQGSFRVDAARSAPNPQVLKAFPDNTEMEGRLTFASDQPGPWVRGVAAVPTSVTLGVRHSFVRLPDDGYEPRQFDPRSGYGSLSFADYAKPISQDITTRYIRRHRLEKKDPLAAASEAVEPIIYYLDRGTPEPVRGALLDGAKWWNQAFEAAGFIDAFQVKVLPEGADPLDVRYNMINWVHRSTRGWSYGSSVTDPRTGEIIKGHVLLGSLRVRQDYLLMEGLMSPYGADAPAEGSDPMLNVALARIRQLSAHEVGHTIGISHNFAASVNDRASVMDYPAPLVALNEEGVLQFGQAYDTGIGAWDKIVVRYGYSVIPDSLNEASALSAILHEGYAAGLRYITDSDARPTGAAHPYSNLWDNGSNPTEALRQTLRVRAVAMSRFGLASIKAGRPLSTIHEALVPLYLHHRYQVGAAAKMVGGSTYTYAVRGDRRAMPTAVPARQQRDALDALLASVSTEVLGLPIGLRNNIPPRPPGFGGGRELFDSYSAPLFDPYVPAEVGASMVFDQLLAPARMARLMYQADADNSLPSLSDVLAQVSDKVWEKAGSRDSYESEIERIVQTVWTETLLEAASNARNAPGVQARLWQHLLDLADWLSDNPGRGFEQIAHRGYTLSAVDRYLTRFYNSSEPAASTTTPPGSPIGSGETLLRRQAERRAWLDAWGPVNEFCGTDD